MTWEVRRIPLWPVAKIGFLLYFALALVVFLLYSIFLGGMMDMVGQMVGQEMSLPVLSGGALMMVGFFLAVFAAIMYTLLTLLAVIVYNAIASMTGGFHLELDPVEGSLPSAHIAPEPVGGAATQVSAAAEASPTPPPPPMPPSEPPEGDPKL